MRDTNSVQLNRRITSCLGFVPIAAAFVFLTVTTWRKWGDVLIDFGANLNAAWQISEGKILYRDFIWLFGPVSQYYHALLFKCFGVSLTPLIFSSLLLTAAVTIFIYLLFLQAAGPTNAAAVSLVFLLVFAFPHSLGNSNNFNYICPYSYEAVHGLFASIASIGLLSLWMLEKNKRLLYLAGFFFGIALLTKPEISAAAAAAVVLAFVLEYSEKKNLRSVLISCAWFLGFAAVPIVFFLIYFCSVAGFFEGVRSTFWSWVVLYKIPLTELKFYRWCLGLDNVRGNLALMIQHFLSAGAAFAMCVLGARWWTQNGRARKCAAVVAYGTVLLSACFFSWTECGRALPLIVAVALVHLLWTRFKSRSAVSSRDLVFPILWTAFGFFLLAKMGINSRIWQYGFVLAMPGAVAAVFYLGWFLPRRLQRFGINPALLSGMVYILFAVGVICLSGISYRYYGLRNYAVGEGGDELFTYDASLDAHGPCINSALAWLKKNTPPDATFVALPHGLGLNYLARRVNPAHYNLFLANEFAIYGVANVLNGLVAAHPDYILIVHSDISDHGAKFFGDSPESGAEILRWVNANYRPVYLAGAEPSSEREFSIQILARMR